MTTQEKLLEAADHALAGRCGAMLCSTGLRDVWEETVIFIHEQAAHDDDWRPLRCLYLCLLAAAWDDL